MRSQRPSTSWGVSCISAIVGCRSGPCGALCEKAAWRPDPVGAPHSAGKRHVPPPLDGSASGRWAVTWGFAVGGWDSPVTAGHRRSPRTAQRRPSASPAPCCPHQKGPESSTAGLACCPKVWGDVVGLRINKSFKIAPGIRIRLGSKSSSLSVGGRVGRVTLNSRGRRTTTVRLAPGVSYSSSKGASPKPSRPAAPESAALTERAPLGTLIAPRRNIAEGWVAADERGVVVHRGNLDDVRIPLVHLASAELDGKELTLKTSDAMTYRLRLTTLSAARDLRFVEALARAARLTQS
ncbi:DUF4236 domain-containing protein [Streptomyces longwoodensis]|uniref:DUF4236 domain-containing protein n=1 Tax=Streptomyces longwoodensis TaxID=68231 RepID=UPI0033C469C4